MPTLSLGVRYAGMFWLLMAVPPAALAADPAAGTNNCQSSTWDMRRELEAFGTAPQSETAGSGAPKAPVLLPDRLYALRLHPQGEVRFAEAPGRAGKSATPMAGMARITVRRSGLYRITLDSPMWIDVVTPEGILAPVDYTGWHDCGVFRKSVVFSLKAGHAVALQFSDAATDLVKMVIEPAASP